MVSINERNKIMAENNFVIWCDVPVKIKRKETILTKSGIKRKFIVGYGDVPVANYNVITDKIEEVVNNRGIAYAARNRLCYKKS
jgi:hypothetical protein